MDAPVTLRVAALAALTAMAPLAAAQLVDPTQPPAAHTPRLLAPAAESAPAESARERRLQMVIRGPGERRIALIGGVRYAVGDAIELDGGPARVTAILDDRVVLTRGTASETLELLPSVTSGPAARAAGPASSR